MRPASSRSFPWLTDRPFAHRGLHGPETGPENSLAAFAGAIAEGFPFELDVRLTSSGTPVVFHDESLARMTGDPRDIAAADDGILRSLRLAGSDERIPRLREVLDLVAGRVPVLIELKNLGRVGDFERRVTRELDGYRGEFAVMSFHPGSVRWFARNVPAVPRGQLSGGFGDTKRHPVEKVLLRRLSFAAWNRPDFIGYEQECLPNAVVERVAARHGIPVLAWTVRCEADLARVREYCDNYVFEGFRPPR